MRIFEILGDMMSHWREHRQAEQQVVQPSAPTCNKANTTAAISTVCQRATTWAVEPGIPDDSRTRKRCHLSHDAASSNEIFLHTAMPDA